MDKAVIEGINAGLKRMGLKPYTPIGWTLGDGRWSPRAARVVSYFQTREELEERVRTGEIFKTRQCGPKTVMEIVAWLQRNPTMPLHVSEGEDNRSSDKPEGTASATDDSVLVDHLALNDFNALDRNACHACNLIPDGGGVCPFHAGFDYGQLTERRSASVNAPAGVLGFINQLLELMKHDETCPRELIFNSHDHKLAISVLKAVSYLYRTQQVGFRRRRRKK